MEGVVLSLSQFPFSFIFIYLLFKCHLISMITCTLDDLAFLVNETAKGSICYKIKVLKNNCQ